MPLPQALRRLTPDRMRDDPRLRAVASGAGLIPPRTMHSDDEAATLARLASSARRVVELGVYEGSSAVVLLRAMAPNCRARCSAQETLLRADAALGGAAPGRLGQCDRDPAGGHPRPAHRRPRIRWIRDAARTSGVVGRAGGPRVHRRRSQLRGCREDWETWRDHVASGGFAAFHDARAGRPGGRGAPGPTRVVDETFRSADESGWTLAAEIDALVVVRRQE